jgi:hypothetical protein
MKLLSVLTPKFLKNLDSYFLLNHRLLWITKIHYVLFYAVTGGLGLSFLVWLYPLRTNSFLPETALMVFLAVLCCLPMAIFWVYKQTIYSVEKKYGNLFPLMEYMRFGIYLLTFGIFVGTPIFFTGLMQHKIDNLVSLEELKTDLDILNSGNPYFPTNRYGDYISEEDKEYLAFTNNGQNNYVELKDGRTFNFHHFAPYYLSFEKNPANDKNYCEQFLQTDNESIKLAYINSYIEVFNKYSDRPLSMSAKEVLWRYHKKEVMPEWVEKNKSDVLKNLYAISEYKYKKIWSEKGLPILFSLFVFSLGTLLLMFQNVKWQDFVVGLISFGFGSLVFGLILAFAYSFLFPKSYKEEVVIIGAILGMFGVFLYQARSIASLSAFSRIKTFSLMFANLLSPFLIFMLVLFISKATNSFYMSSEEAQTSLVLGMIVHTIFFIPFYRAMYLKMRSLPHH